MDTHLVETYFDWLKSEAFSIASERREYEGVLRVLHDIPFYWTILSDDNRVGDALIYRQYGFLEVQKGLDDMDQALLERWATAAPSVLEILLAISRRWNEFFEGEVSYYFGHLFHNMGFDRFPGKHLTGPTQDLIRNKVDIWMSRTFNANGLGSPFPLNHGFNATADQRTVDIWGQMNAYSLEHFQ